MTPTTLLRTLIAALAAGTLLSGAGPALADDGEAERCQAQLDAKERRYVACRDTCRTGDHCIRSCRARFDRGLRHLGCRGALMHVRTRGPYGDAVRTVEIVDGRGMLEDDISVGPVSKLVRVDEAAPAPANAAIGDYSTRWPNGTVPYAFDKKLKNRDGVMAAIAGWTQQTTLRFVPHTNEYDYVVFKYTPGEMSSDVGCQGGGRQYINVGTGTHTGKIMHEIGHAVGLFHEQTRHDRDKYVTILWDNIKLLKKHNFEKYDDGVDVGPWEWDSLMLYPSFVDDFANTRGKPVIVRKDGTPYPAPQRDHLTDADRRTVERLYHRSDASVLYVQEAARLGDPYSSISPTRDGYGFYIHARYGSVYWYPFLGAHFMMADIRAQWWLAGSETAEGLGFPTRDDTPSLYGGHWSEFERGAIYAHPTAGVHTVRSAILTTYKVWGAERGTLGYPTTDEQPYGTAGDRIIYFQQGWITVSASTGQTSVGLRRPTVPVPPCRRLGTC